MIFIGMSSLSTAYVQLQIVITSPAGFDPSSDVVQFAFMADAYPMNAPGPSDWHAGSWSVLPGPQYWAQCLVGPANGGVVLSQGLWQVWLKVTDNPEVPVIQQAMLQVNP